MKSGITVRSQTGSSQIVGQGRQPVYRKEDQPRVNVSFTDAHTGLSIQVKLRREVTDWLESLPTEEVNNIIRESLETWKTK